MSSEQMRGEKISGSLCTDLQVSQKESSIRRSLFAAKFGRRRP